MKAFIDNDKLRASGMRFLDILYRVLGVIPLDGSRPLTEKQYAKLWDKLPSFTEYLPFKDFNREDGVFHFEDGFSVGAVFELTAIDIEGRPVQIVKRIEDGIQKALLSLPGHHDSPWILQSYLEDEPLHGLLDKIRNYATPEARTCRHFDKWMEILEEHIQHMSQPGGMFYDSGSQFHWNGQYRRVRFVLYRRSKRSEWLNRSGKPLPGRGTPANELNEVATGFLGQLQQAGVHVKRYTGKELFNWLLPWFSPKPDGFENAWDYLNTRHYPEDDSAIGVSSDLAEMVTLGYPESQEDGTWLFTGTPQRLIPLQAIDTPPLPGMLTAEQETQSGMTASLWDRLPKGSRFVSTIVVLPQSSVKKHCDDIIKAAGQGSSEAKLASNQAKIAKDNIAAGNFIYPSFSGLYVRGDNDNDLAANTRKAIQVLSSYNLNPISPRFDPTSTDNYLRFLPMAYSYEHDKKSGSSTFTRLTYSNHLARLLPLYGRGYGTGKAGEVYFNRVGGPLMIDPVNDRARVAHRLLFGPTGAGKSAMINYMVMHDMAIYKPRTFIIEKGDSFGLLGQYFESHGLKVNRVKFTPTTDIALPPYAMAFEALDQAEKNQAAMDRALLMSADDAFDKEGQVEDVDGDMRDYLGEMELITRMMITGADIKREAAFDQPDKLVVRQAILEATRRQRDAGKSYVIPSNVVEALRDIAGDQGSEKRREQIMAMADSLQYWTEGLHGKFFNRPGEAWPECDLTILDMGILTSDQYQDMLAVTIVSLINTITGIGEKYQFEGRQTKVWTDEGHAITTNPALAKPLVFGAKTWRKLNIWLNQATQNLEDYPDESKKMLTLAEWWYCLNMSMKEIEDLARFRRLNDEEKALIESARKEKGKYTEGVVLSDNVNSLFRVVMPALPLALAGTDDDEKSARRRIMNEQDCSELQAVYVMAERIKESRCQA
ncbi:MAG: conjugative transfer ATPase [Candidatus Thiodiazotropha endolucinida]